MTPQLSRREFLLIMGLSMGSIAAGSFHLPEGEPAPIGQARVTTDRISRMREPSFHSDRLGWLKRDKLVDLFQEIHSPDGPANNNLWYQLDEGFAHSSYLQRFESHQVPPIRSIPASGQLVEVIVPFTQSLRNTRSQGWIPLYRLYYESNHWATDLVEGPDGKGWVEITDERLRVRYAVPANHLRRIRDEEITPISPDVPQELKRIEVSLEKQELTAFEDREPVFKTKISSGIKSRGPTINGIPTETPKGRFLINRKMPVRHMGDGNLTADPRAYELPGVPWAAFFVATGVAFHGTYWHNNFGTPMSHGCVNMRNEDAKWLFRWTTPLHGAGEWMSVERGTTVDVI